MHSVPQCSQGEPFPSTPSSETQVVSTGARFLTTLAQRWCLLLSTLRDIPGGFHSTREGGWGRLNAKLAWAVPALPFLSSWAVCQLGGTGPMGDVMQAGQQSGGR